VNLKKRRGEKILIWVAVLFVAVVVIYCVMDFSSSRTWKQFQLQMKAQGESLEFADFIPKPVPDNQNFALAPIVASSYSQLLDPHGNLIIPPKTSVVNHLDMEIYDNDSGVDIPTNYLGGWIKGKKADLKAQQLYYRALSESKLHSINFQIPSQPGMPAKDILLALSKYDSNVEELRLAAQLPYSRFPLNYNSPQPYDIELPHIEALTQCNQMLELRALAELENNQNDLAIADIKLSLRLISSIRSEPSDISQFVRIRMLGNILQPVWQGLNGHNWRDDQLISLENELEKIDFLSDFEFTIRCQRAEEIGAIEYYRRTRRLDDLFDMDNDDTSDSSASEAMTKIIRSSFYHSIPDSVFYQNEINIGKYIQDLILPITDSQKQTISPDAKNAAVLALENSSQYRSPNNMIAFMLLPAMPTESEGFAFAQNSVNMAKVACALESYRLVYGNYPQKLDALSPQFIDKIPHDIINGHSLKYHPTQDEKYVLYSVGWNKTDDGGIIALRNGIGLDRQNGDWVWNGTGVTNEMLNP
jgi:hypothetical protein